MKTYSSGLWQINCGRNHYITMGSKPLWNCFINSFYISAVWYQDIVSKFLVYRKVRVFFCKSREFKCEFKMVLTPLCTILHESKVVLVFAQWLFIFWQTDIRQRSHYFFWLLAPPNSPHFSLFSYFNTQIMKSWRNLFTLFLYISIMYYYVHTAFQDILDETEEQNFYQN
jgi:hypothetical protein